MNADQFMVLHSRVTQKSMDWQQAESRRQAKRKLENINRSQRT